MEEDENNVLSPILSTAKNLTTSPILSTKENPSQVSAETTKFDPEPHKSPPCSPVLYGNKVEKSKDDVRFSSNVSNFLPSAKNKNMKKPSHCTLEQLSSSFVSKKRIQDIKTPSEMQPELKLLPRSSYDFKEPCLCDNKKIIKTKKIRLFSHEPLDNYENVSEKPVITRDLESLKLQSDEPKAFEDNESTEFGSPELKSRRVVYSNSVSPEIKTKKAIFQHKQKVRYSKSHKNSSQSLNFLKNSIGERIFISANVHSNCSGELNYSNTEKNIFSGTLNVKTTENVQEISNIKQDEIPMENEVTSVPLKDCKTSESSPSKSKSRNTDFKSVSLSDLPTSPILEIKFSAAKKRKKRPYLVEKNVGSCKSVKSHTEGENSSCEPKMTAFDEASNTTLGSSDRMERPSRPEPKVYSVKSSPLMSHEKLTTHSSTPLDSPYNQFSPFNDKFTDFSTATPSSTGANIKNICKRLSFHASSTEKRRSKGVKPALRLDLKKTNKLEDQFSRLSQFCKVNTTLSTKSPSNLTIRRSKLKRFDANKEEKSTLTSNLSCSESYYNFDKSPSPVLHSSVNSLSRLNRTKDNCKASDKSEIPLNTQENIDEPHSSECERIDHDPPSPCFKTPKKVINHVTSSNMSSDSGATKPVIKFKFSCGDAVTSENDKKICYGMNEPVSPILEFRKKKILKTSHLVRSGCNIDADQDSQSSQANYSINITDVNIDENITDDQKILNETIFEEKASKENLQTDADIDENDVISSQIENIVARTQGSMTIEVSESSGTQQSHISDGNLPCDNVRDEESSAHQPSSAQNNLPPPNDDIYESAKKKKRRYKNGTLSARLNRLLKRTRSEMRMWAHEMLNEASDSMAINLIVDVVSFEMNKWLLKCRIISDSEEGNSSDPYFVILHPSAISNSLVTPGTVLKVFPKWETLDLLSPKVTVIFNITRVTLIPNPSSTSLSKAECTSKQTIQVVDPQCSCSRDSVNTACVHKLLSRKTLLGPLLPDIELPLL